MSGTLITMTLLLGAGAVAQVWRLTPALVASPAGRALARGFLALLGALLAALAVRTAPLAGGAPLLAALAAFGLAHVPAAAVLMLKARRARETGRTGEAH
jgi:hypothetical protein